MPGKRATAMCVYKDLFSPSHRCLTPPSWGTPCDINAIYTSLKSTISGLQFRRWQYGSVLIRLAVIASETREMSRNSKGIWPYSSSRSSKVINLGVNGKPVCDFLLVINCNFSRICYRSCLKIENCWFYPPLPCLMPLSGLKDEKLIKSKSTWKLKHTNSILESSEYFCQMSSKSILTISSYMVSKLAHFF